MDVPTLLRATTWAEVQTAAPALAAEAEAQEAVFPAGSCLAARDAAVERLVQSFPGLSPAVARHVVALVSAPEA